VRIAALEALLRISNELLTALLLYLEGLSTVRCRALVATQAMNQRRN